ncbi:MAG: Ribosomal protein methylthiotransferase accessory factor [Candidatus Eremiobacteraeota bacterium]|nr:Ribosomal protein methylthiotransferase accessory factor [Candidatus Eremiobacteraeota bacterium]
MTAAVSDANLASRFIDERIGIVGELREVGIAPGDPDFVHFFARAADTASLSGHANFSTGGGASADRPAAAMKAIGEAVERYCAALYDVADFPLTSARDADIACVSPAAFALHGSEQYDSPGFPWVRFDDDTVVRWTQTVDVITGRPAWVPAAFVWLPYTYERGSEDTPIGQPISTGLAAHRSYERAAVSGLCEVIERDAFTIAWLSRAALPQLRVETLSDANYDLVERLEATGDHVVLLDATLDTGVPAIIAVLQSEAPDRPAYVVAAAADADPEVAVRKALEELPHTRRYSQRIKDELDPIADDGVFDHVTTQIDHLNFAAGHEHRPYFTFLFASKQRRSFDELNNLSTGVPATELALLASRVESVGHRVLVADLTSEDVAACGMRVTRTVIPGFHPLFMGHRIRPLGGTRLYEVPKRLGLDVQPGANPAPHPFP